MLDGITAEHVLMDKGYDSDPLVAAIEKSGVKAVIPPRSNRKTPREYDREVYRDRNKIERLFGRLKTVPPHRHPHRETRPELHGLPASGLSDDLAGVIVNSD